MIFIFDKDIDPNITEVTSGDVVGDVLYWQSESSHAWVIDRTGFQIRIGADDSSVTFTSLEAMDPYLDQLISLSSVTVPGVDPINEDAFYDKPDSGEIVELEEPLQLTDIEQEWKDGTRGA